MNVGCFGDPSVHVDLLSVVYKSVNMIPSSVQSVVWNVFIFHHSMHIYVSVDTQTFRLPPGSKLQTDTVFGPAYFKKNYYLTEHWQNNTTNGPIELFLSQHTAPKCVNPGQNRL